MWRADTGQNAFETKEKGGRGEVRAGRNESSALPVNASHQSYHCQIHGSPPLDIQPKPEGAAAW